MPIYAYKSIIVAIAAVADSFTHCCCCCGIKPPLTLMRPEVCNVMPSQRICDVCSRSVYNILGGSGVYTYL